MQPHAEEAEPREKLGDGEAAHGERDVPQRVGNFPEQMGEAAARGFLPAEFLEVFGRIFPGGDHCPQHGG